MNIGIIFGQMLVLFAMMLIGYFTYWRDWITDDMSKRLSRLVVNVFNPVLVVNGVLGQRREDGTMDFFSNLSLIAGYFVILILFANVILLVLRPEKKIRSMYRLMTVFSNLGFMGIPVTKSIFGDQAMIYVAFYILGYNLLLYTYGMYLAKKSMLEYTGGASAGNTAVSRQSMGEALKKMINPGVTAALLAVLIFAGNIRLPSPIYTFCDYVGNATIPLSMILIGVSVAQADLKQIFADWRVYLFILLRMVALPVVLTFLMKGLPLDKTAFGVFIVEMGMPVGSIVTLIVKENGADGAYCTKGVVLSTLASIVTIPVICMFL